MTFDLVKYGTLGAAAPKSEGFFDLAECTPLNHFRAMNSGQAYVNLNTLKWMFFKSYKFE